MRKTQLDFLCETFGNSELSSNEKWKCIKYIFVENPIVDVQLLIRRNEIKYIDNTENGPGFYIMSTPNNDLGIPTLHEKTITFIPLKIIDKISLVAQNIDIDLINIELFNKSIS